MTSRKEILTAEVTEKLRLEAIFKPGIRKIFARVADDFRVAVARTGQPQEVSRYRTPFEALLEDHYRRVQKAFSGAILKHSKVATFSDLRKKAAKPDEEESKIKELIWAIFLLWDEQHAPVQTDFILRTTADDMGNAIDQARQALREENKPADNRSLSMTAAAILKRILKGRVDLIAVTETQTAAETAKAIEVSATARVLIPGIPLPRDIVPLLEPTVAPTPVPGAGPRLAPVQPVLKKSWISLRDKRVRHTHVEADRVYSSAAIPVNEAFIVGSSRMMYPGDTSLGAPIREIAHCRCSAQYIF